MMEEGRRADELFDGKGFPMQRLGIIGVVNRSFEDIKNKKTLEEARTIEADFFRKRYLLRASINGIDYLRIRLHQVLMASDV